MAKKDKKGKTHQKKADSVPPAEAEAEQIKPAVEHEEVKILDQSVVSIASSADTIKA